MIMVFVFLLIVKNYPLMFEMMDCDGLRGNSLGSTTSKNMDIDFCSAEWNSNS